MGSLGAGHIRLVVTLVMAAGCSDDGGGDSYGPREHGGEDVGGHIVATVDGVGVSVADIESVVEQTDLSPEEALALLEEQELLAAEARRRGFGARRQSNVVRAQARVQRFLASRVEGVVTPDSISDDAVARRYEEWNARFHVPERRASLHFLTRVEADADEAKWVRAEAFAAGVLADAVSGDPEAVFALAGDQAPPSLTTTVESLPLYANDGSLEAPYSEALFMTPAGTVHPRTVRTSFGVHVLYVKQVEPQREMTLEDASEEIREALVTERRAALLEEIVTEGKRARPVEVREPAFSRAAALEIGS